MPKKTGLNIDRNTVAAASRRILQDDKQRKQFLANPTDFLKQSGIPIRKHMKLSARDKAIITMVADPEVSSIYKSGDVTKLSRYLRENYKSLINDPSRVAWTVADFHVAVEAVAVAVGVFVAPLRAPDDFSEVARIEAVFTARIDQLERTIAGLQSKVEALSRG